MPLTGGGQVFLLFLFLALFTFGRLRNGVNRGTFFALFTFAFAFAWRQFPWRTWRQFTFGIHTLFPFLACEDAEEVADVGQELND